MLSSESLPVVDRRALLRGAILLVGGSLAGLPADAFAQLAQSDRFFSEARFAVLDEVAETIIPRTDTPGARDVGVPGLIDALMTNWASDERGRDFRALLDDIDSAAGRSGLLALPAEERFDLIRRYDAEKLYEPVYSWFKELVLTLYYLSEEGATQELRYELVPGAWDASTTVTPDTRAWAV